MPNVHCSYCGKNLSTDDLRGTNCTHCGTVLPHRARAAEQVALVQGMLADQNGNGIPDAFEPLVQNAQRNAAMHVQASFGLGPPPAGGFGAPVQMPYGHVQIAHAPPVFVPNVPPAAKKSVAGVIILLFVLGALIGLLFVGGAVAFLLFAGPAGGP